MFPTLFFFVLLSFSSVAAQIVQEIELILPPGVEEEKVRPYLGIREGEELSLYRIDQGLHSLYARGLFKEIEVTQEELPEGIRLVYLFKPKTRLASWKFYGNKRFSNRQLRHLLKLQGGEIIDEALLERWREKVEEAYHKEGYPSVKVHIQLEPRRRLQSHLKMTIEEGKGSTIESIHFIGSPGLSRALLLDALELQRGDLFRWSQMEASKRNLRALLFEEGYYEATIGEERLAPIEDRPGAVELLIPIFARSRYRLEFQQDPPGTFSYSQLKKGLGWEEEEGIRIRRGFLDLSSERLQEFLQRRGYPSAEVTAEVIEEIALKRIVFRLRLGERGEILPIEWRGVTVFSKEELEEKMWTRRSGRWGFLFWKLFGRILGRPYRGYYVESEVEKDLEAVRNFYREEGFLDAFVELEKIEVTPGGDVRLTIGVVEGERIRVRRLDFVGADHWTREELLQIVPIQVGAPVNFREVEIYRNRLELEYSRRGYIGVKVEVQTKFDPDGSWVDIEYRIHEGEQYRFGKTIFSGNRQTKDFVLQRELRYREGDPYNAEKVFESQRRLYQLGIFRSATIEPAPFSSDELMQDLVVRTKERKPGLVEFGFGYSTGQGIRGFAGVTYRNLFGTARSVFLRGSASFFADPLAITNPDTDLPDGLNEEKVEVGYKEPWLLGWDIDLRLHYINQLLREIDFDSRENSVIVAIDREFTPSLKGSFQYQLELLRRFDVEPTATDIEEGKLQLGLLGPILIWDTRDDPFNPVRGHFSTFQIEVSDEPFLSKERFVKGQAKSTHFWSPLDPLLWITHFQIGLGFPYGFTESIPREERFFLGGGTSVRGFTQDSLGPIDVVDGDRVPLGGEAMSSYTLEMRFPIWRDLGGALFTDGGAVWEDFGRINLGDFRFSAGVGARYKTPIGPLRFDWGHKLDQRAGESPSEFHFLVGNVF